MNRYLYQNKSLKDLITIGNSEIKESLLTSISKFLENGDELTILDADKLETELEDLTDAYGEKLNLQYMIDSIQISFTSKTSTPLPINHQYTRSHSWEIPIPFELAPVSPLADHFHKHTIYVKYNSDSGMIQGGTDLNNLSDLYKGDGVFVALQGAGGGGGAGRGTAIGAQGGGGGGGGGFLFLYVNLKALGTYIRLVPGTRGANGVTGNGDEARNGGDGGSSCLYIAEATEAICQASGGKGGQAGTPFEYVYGGDGGSFSYTPYENIWIITEYAGGDGGSGENTASGKPGSSIKLDAQITLPLLASSPIELVRTYTEGDLFYIGSGGSAVKPENSGAFEADGGGGGGAVFSARLNSSHILVGYGAGGIGGGATGSIGDNGGVGRDGGVFVFMAKLY